MYRFIHFPREITRGIYCEYVVTKVSHCIKRTCSFHHPATWDRVAAMHCHLFRLRMLLAAVCLVPSIPVVAQDAAPPAPADVPMILRISAREVVLDVVARDKNHNSVNDLAESDFQAFETGKHADKNPHRILSLRVIDH